MANLHLFFNEQAARSILPGLRKTPFIGRVFYLKDDLSYGPLPVDVDNFYPRYQWLEDFFGEYSDNSLDIPYYANLRILGEIDDRMRHPGNRLFCWYGGSACDQSWLRYVSMYFAEWDNIAWVRPLNADMQDAPDRDEVVASFESRVHPSTDEIRSLSREYRHFVNARSLLRITDKEGKLITMPLSEYDEAILEAGQDQLQKLQVAYGLPDKFLNARLRQLRQASD